MPTAVIDHAMRRDAPVLAEVGAMWRFARESGFARELKALHRPRLSRSLAAAGLDWALIALAAGGVMALGWWMVVPALLVIGNRQRALGNLLHDASHWSLDGERPRAHLLANLLLCWPLWVSLAIYRDEHNRHHKFLGDPARDPDFIHGQSPPGRGWLGVWFDQLVSPAMFRGNAFGHIARMDAASRLGVVLWWMVVLSALSTALGMANALIFAGLWLGARATTFHAITAFRELCDHVGLEPGRLIGFSRNLPFGGFLGQVFHPHHNGYHLLHHLNPGIPFHALPRAHALLLRWPPYAAGEHCAGYFGEGDSATRSWIRRRAIR